MTPIRLRSDPVAGILGLLLLFGLSEATFTPGEPRPDWCTVEKEGYTVFSREAISTAENKVICKYPVPYKEREPDCEGDCEEI